MKATFMLLNRYFWKTIYGPIISFVFPVILLVILGHIFKIEYIFPGIIAMAIIFIAVLALPLAIMEFRGSSLFKYIGSSPISTKKFAIVAISFYAFIMMVAVFLIYLMTLAAFSTSVLAGSKQSYKIVDGKSGLTAVLYNYSNSIFSNLLTFKGVSEFFLSIGLHMIFSIFVGLAISTFSKTPQQALTVSIVIIIPSMFLSGMVVSVDIIASSSFMQWVSRFIPFRYTVANIVTSATPLSQTHIFLDPEQLHILLGDNNPIKPGANGINFPTPINGDKPTVIQQMVLYNQFPLVEGSSNDIFDFTSQFTVRRVPNIEQIRSFMIEFLRGNSDPKKFDSHTGRFISLWTQMSKGNWSWLDLFIHQNNVLYTQAERVLNIFGPIIASGLLGWYVALKFKWTSR